ncbi:MAG: inositol phosphatase, partial [Myxococcales bacterium]|nr:inositol phosphatase [Myxococcales bacterium]
RSPVTEADKAVEAHLREVFDKHFPTFAFLGEETGKKESASGLRFIVDPIDGTRAFLRGIPTWSVLLGIECDGVPVVGIAHFPADGDMLVGATGHGVTHNGGRVAVSQVESLDDAVISHGSLLQFTGASMDALLGALGRGTYTQRGFCDFDGYRKLLLGQVDAMIEPGIQAWDICPAAVLVREAGGRFTDFEGTDSIHSGTAIASNGRIHDALLALVKRAVA